MLGVHAQQRKSIRLLGVLMSTQETDREFQSYSRILPRRAPETGWIQGQNIRTESRWGGLNDELRRQFAEELVALRPDLILSQNTPTTAALLRQTRSIPIIFANLSDPVGSGFVEGLARPGGNVTGSSTSKLPSLASLSSCSISLLPMFRKLEYLYNPSSATCFEYHLDSLRAAARSLGVAAIPTPIRDLSELESAIAALAREPNGSLLVIPDAYTTSYRAEITSLAAADRLQSCIRFDSRPWRRPDVVWK